MDEDDAAPVRYRNPPKAHRFQKGRSGNPTGRRKRKLDFFADAREILGGTVTGRAKDKSITLPMVQAMFRSMCRQALSGDNGALRRVIELQLLLVPLAAGEAAEKALEEKGKREFLLELGVSSDQIGRPRPKPKKMTPEEELETKKSRERLLSTGVN